ncbi:hypothetical protein DRJ19_02570 [Candidatus Woesearchaeota archaeon]|nr:MAG: hypothetical protein DRJ19_02570 [Candidatus Woesearchaeota archaeon]
MDEVVLRRTEEMGVERSALIRGAVEMALGADSLTEVLKEKERLRSEVRALRRECEEKDRRIRELEREVERSMRRIAELEEKLAKKEGRIEELREEMDAKKYRTSFGWLTAEEIKQLYKEKNPVDPKAWLSSVLLGNSLAIQEVAALLGLQDSSSSSSAVADAKTADVADASAENAEERERIERMLKARDLRRRRRMMSEMDFKRLAEDLGLTEEEARSLVEEKFSEASSEEASEMIKRARSILEGY